MTFTIAGLLAFILGCVLTYWFVSAERLKDEYAYTLKVNNLLFYNQDHNSEMANKDLNNLLYFHVNRYLNLRKSLPKSIKKQEDKLFCSMFIMSDADKKIYKDILTKAKLYDYIYSNLSFCNS